MTSFYKLSPQEEEDVITEVGDREAELLEEALKSVHDDGYVVFGPAKGAQQLVGFVAETHPSEFLMMLDPDYVAKMDAGLYPPPIDPAWYLMGPDGKPVKRPSALQGFYVTIFASQDEAVQWGTLIGMITPEMLQPTVDPMTQQTLAPQLPVTSMPSYWGTLLQLPRFDDGKDGPLHWELADLRRLWSQWGRKREGVTT